MQNIEETAVAEASHIEETAVAEASHIEETAVTETPPAKKKEKKIADEQSSRLDALDAQVAALAEVVAAGSATIETRSSAAKTADDLPVFEHDGIAYRFRVHSFSLDGSDTYNSAEVAQDEALTGMIVSDYPGLIERA